MTSDGDRATKWNRQHSRSESSVTVLGTGIRGPHVLSLLLATVAVGPVGPDAKESGAPAFVSNGGGQCKDIPPPLRPDAKEGGFRRWLAGLSSCTPGTVLVYTWAEDSSQARGPYTCATVVRKLLDALEVTAASANLTLESTTSKADSVVTSATIGVEGTTTGSFQVLVVPEELILAIGQFSGTISLDFNKLREVCEQLGIDFNRSARDVLKDLQNRGLFTEESLIALFLSLEEHGLFLDEAAAALFLAASELNLFVEVSGAALYAFCTGQGISFDLFAQEIARYVETHSAEVEALLRSLNLRADTARFLREAEEGGGDVIKVAAKVETGSTLLRVEIERESYEPRATVKKTVRQASAIPWGRLDYEISVSVGPAPPSAILVVDVLPPELDVLQDAAEELEFPPRVYRDKAAKRTYVIWYLDDSYFVGEEGRWGATFHLPVRVLTPPLLPRTDLDQ